MKSLVVKSSCAILLLGALAYSIDTTPGTDPGLGIANCSAGKGWYTLLDSTQMQTSVNKYFFLPPGQSHGNGGKWTVTGNILASDQAAGGDGGALFTKHQYKNVEVKVYLQPYFGNDGGLFLRSNAQDKSYQCTMDYLKGTGKAVGGVWGESGLHSINYKPFEFVTGSQINASGYHWAEVQKEPPTSWGTKIWNPNGYNWVHAQIYHNDPPFINTFVNDYQMIHYEDNKVEAGNLVGYIGLQIHRGTGNWNVGHPNLYKAFLVREINPTDAAPLASYPDWEKACPTTAVPGKLAAEAGPEMKWSFDRANSLRLTGHSDQPFVITVTDVAGKMVYTAHAASGNYEYRIDLPGSGIHVVGLQGNGFHRTVKVFRVEG